MVMVAMPSPLPRPAANVTTRVLLDLEIAPDGHVVNATVLESSGDVTFDEKVRKFYSRFRLVPALDEHGTPITSIYRFNYKYSVDQDGKTEAPVFPTGSVSSPPPDTFSTGGIGKAKVFDEVDRITRMRCKDFLWEYDLMKEIARSKPLYNERMLRTSLAMFIVHEKVTGEEINALNIVFSEGVRATVNECRKHPDAKYFMEALAPALDSKLRH